MGMQDIKCVIFDLDGTLVEFKLRVRDAKREILSRFKEYGISLDGLSEDDSIKTIIQRVKHKAEEKGIDPERVVFEIMERYELEASNNTNVREGVEKTLRKLKSIGMVVVVATNSCRKVAKLTLERFGLINYIDHIVTRDDVENIKPADDVIRKSLEITGLKPNQVVYVGDSTYDIEASRSAGVKSIAILGGIHSENELRSKNPDYIIASIDELITKVLGMDFKE